MGLLGNVGQLDKLRADRIGAFLSRIKARKLKVCPRDQNKMALLVVITHETVPGYYVKKSFRMGWTYSLNGDNVALNQNSGCA